MNEVRPRVLVVAGFDASGGAGILRDLATLQAMDLDTVPIVTAVTAQNHQTFEAFEAVSPALLLAEARLALGHEPPELVKIGMLGSVANTEAIGGLLRELDASARARGRRMRVVADPLLAAGAGGRLTTDDDLSAWSRAILPCCEVVTPNVPEAEVLARRPIRNREDMVDAARIIAAGCGVAVVIKGGHLEGPHVDDVLSEAGGRVTVFRRRRLLASVHGSGCTFSATLAGGLVLGNDLADAVWMAGNAVVERLVRAARRTER